MDERGLTVLRHLVKLSIAFSFAIAAFLTTATHAATSAPTLQDILPNYGPKKSTQNNYVRVADRSERREKRRERRAERRRERRAERRRERRAERRRERRFERRRERRKDRRRFRRDYDDGDRAAAIIGTIGGIIVNEALRDSRRSDFERCDDRYRTFRWSDGTYIPRPGERRLCPYLR